MEISKIINWVKINNWQIENLEFKLIEITIGENGWNKVYLFDD